MRLLFFLFPILVSATTFQHRYFEDVLLENMPARSKIYNGNPTMEYFTQKMDHFDTNNQETYQQQFYVDSSNWRGAGQGPVFLYMGGESDLDQRTFEFSWCAEYAPENGALCLALEHRFYGDSFPIHNPNPEDLKLLSASQALADASNFIAAMTERYWKIFTQYSSRTQIFILSLI